MEKKSPYLQSNEIYDTTTTTTTTTTVANITTPRASKLMSFLPPPAHPAPPPPTERNGGLLSLVYNKHEPLGVNSETRIDDNEETIRTNFDDTKHQSSIYEEVSSSRLKFTSHLDQCSTSLARLVNLINNNNTKNAEPVVDNGQIYNDLTFNDLLLAEKNHLCEDEVTTNKTKEDLYSKIGSKEENENVKSSECVLNSINLKNTKSGKILVCD